MVIKLNKLLNEIAKKDWRDFTCEAKIIGIYESIIRYYE